MRNYVIINGVNSLTKNGLAIKDLPPITKTMMRTLREEIDGRDGDIITELGYSAYDKSMTIGLFGTGYDIDDIIAFFNQSGTIVFSNEPDKFYNFKIIDQIDYNKLLKFKEATIRFHCQPFKYPLNEVPLVEEYQYVEATGTDVTLDNTGAGIFNKIELQGDTFQSNALLPNEYTQVEYIQSNGNQYIDTGLVGGLNKTLKIRMMPLNTSDVFIYGSRQSAGNTAVYLSNRMVNNGWQISYGNVFYSAADTYTPNEVVEMEACLAKGNQYIKKNGATIYTNTISDELETFTQHDYLFSFNNAGNAGNKASMRLYDCQILEGTILKRHFIPCYRNSDNVIGLYDLVSNSFFTNAGTGSFTKGNNAALPNPNYPQDIHVVSGDNTIDIVGKNLFDGELEAGTIDVNGNNVNSTDRVRTKKFTHVVPNEQYYLSSNFGSIDSSVNNTIYGRCYDKNKTYIQNLNITKNGSFTIPDNIYYFRWQYIVGNGNQTNAIENHEIMLKKGSAASTYEPYQSQSLQLNLGNLEMASIPNTDYKDTFVKIDDVWYKRESVGKYICSATENWNTMSYGTNSWRLYNVMTFNPIDNETLIMTTQFKGIPKNDRNTNASVIYVDGSNVFAIRNTPYTTKEQAQSGMNGQPIYYAKATTTDIEVNETLADQLEAIKNAVSYEGQTNITQTNNDLPFILDLSALELNSDHLVINNIGNIYSKPTLDLEGTGIVDVYLNDIQMFEVDLTENNEIIINTDEMEAFNPETGALANRQVTGEYDVFKLDPGENDLRFSGNLTKATITNYERWL